MKVYISTMAFLGMPIEQIIERGIARQYPVEFSSALPFHKDMVEHFLAYPHAKLAHNYFPAPEKAFVLNLASKDEHIRQQSIQHCLQGLELSAKAKAPFFAAHAGFCLDPKPEELGQRLKQSTDPIDREAHWQLFLQSLAPILDAAERCQVDFYIENNVTAEMNINTHGQNPLLCSTPEELKRLATTINHPQFGILLDTAHLKVSGQTLNFDIKAGTKLICPYIKAIHHSDNEGKLDNNQALTSNYWFLEFMPYFSNIPQVIEVKQLEDTQIDTQIRLLKTSLDIEHASANSSSN